MRRNLLLPAVFTLLCLAAPPATPQAGKAAAPALQIDVIARVSGRFVSPAGTEPPGFDVEVLRRFAAWHRTRHGNEVQLGFTYTSAVPLVLEALQRDKPLKGAADLGLGGVTATPERARQFDFSTATLPVRSVLVAPPGVLDPARWRRQIAGLRLGATVGSTNAAEVERLAKTFGARANTSLPSNEAVFAALGGPSRTLDSAVVDLPQYWVTGKQKGLVMVDSVGPPQSMGFVLRKGSPLKASVDQFLGAFTRSSEYFQLIRTYFGHDAEKMVRMARGKG
jgi:ABC-type amino acid transport substrate-binding protein